MSESESWFRLREIIISRFQNAGLSHSTAMLRSTIDWLLALHAQVSHAALNVVAESFLGLLKCERINRVRYRTLEEARADVFGYIEVIYNHKQRHGFLVISVCLSSNTRQPIFMKQSTKTMQDHISDARRKSLSVR